MASTPKPYIGRFAPSPTGPLHFGSLLAAVGSYCQARHQGGTWLVRMEDLDSPRCQTGADSLILNSLESYGLHWDGEVLYQSTRTDAYAHALACLRRQNQVYACNCSRKIINAVAKTGKTGPIYPGTCRTRHHKVNAHTSQRLLTENVVIQFEDGLQGHHRYELEAEIGDFVLLRADQLYAYQLAVVVDDAHQNITEIVRGSDLLHNTPMQLHLQQLLDYATPGYLHLPILINAQGQKLSKQSFAAPVPQDRPGPVLCQVLSLLGQVFDPALVEATAAEILEQASTDWDMQNLPQTLSIPLEQV